MQLSFISVKYHYFSIIPGHINASVPPWHMFKKCQCDRNLAPALCVIHKRPFPRPHYSGIYYRPNVASVAQTNDLVWGMICQDDNATPYSSCWTQQLLQLFHWELLDHPPYSWHCWSSTLEWLPIPQFMNKQKRLHTPFFSNDTSSQQNNETWYLWLAILRTCPHGGMVEHLLPCMVKCSPLRTQSFFC